MINPRNTHNYTMDDIYQQRDEETFQGLVIAEKFTLIKQSDNVFVGKYPLEPYIPEGRGAYGGDLISQATLAAYETLEPNETDFTLHSLHSYFLKAGSVTSPMRYEVDTNSKGKSYINKSVKCFDIEKNVLAFMLMCSFTPKNSIKTRKLEYAEGKSKRVPFEFIRTPGPIFQQYKDKIDDLLIFEHTHDLISHGLTMDHIKPTPKHKLKGRIGDSRRGLFCKVNDIIPPNESIKTIDLLYLSDSFYLGLLPKALGIEISTKSTAFFRVSLDHAVHIYDTDYNPTDWLYLDYTFSRMSNGRVLCQCHFYDLQEKLLASVTQEGLVDIPLEWVEGHEGGSYKL